MAISGIGQNYYQNNVETKRNTKNVNGTEKFALEKTGSTQELSEAEEMELFKKEFYEDLSKVTNHRTVSNAAVNISEAAFKAMKEDPQYREKVLSLIQRDWGDSYAPRNCSVLITVGATLNEYRADSWPVGYDSEFDVRSQNSFYKRTSEKKTGRRNCWKNIWKSGRRLSDSSRSYWMKRLQRRSRREAGWQRHGLVTGRWRRHPMLMMQMS